MTQQNQNLQSIISQIVANVSGASFQSVSALIEATNEIRSTRFASIGGYSSDATDNTEIANHVVNFGFVYENMKTKDIECLVLHENGEMVRENGMPVPKVALDILERAVEVANYSKVNLDKLGMTLQQYQTAVKACLPVAYQNVIESAMRPAGSSGKANNFVPLNRVLTFNTKTNSLCVIGQSISKNIIEEAAEEKLVAKAPMTFAQDLIKKIAGCKTTSYRMFKINNMSNVRVNGETVEIQ